MGPNEAPFPLSGWNNLESMLPCPFGVTWDLPIFLYFLSCAMWNRSHSFFFHFGCCSYIFHYLIQFEVYRCRGVTLYSHLLGVCFSHREMPITHETFHRRSHTNLQDWLTAVKTWKFWDWVDFLTIFYRW